MVIKSGTLAITYTNMKIQEVFQKKALPNNPKAKKY